MQKLSLIIALLAMGLGNVWADQATWKVSSSATYTQGDELSSNTAIVSVTLGNGTWAYNSGRGGIYVADRTITRDATTNVPTAGDYIVIKPKVDINFSLSCYASQSNCDLIMVEASAPTKAIKDFRTKDAAERDFGTLSAGNTYYIYGASYKSSGDLDYIFYKSFTAKEMCAAPTFSPTAGELTEATSITLSTTTTEASIYYTTDGTDPTISSTLYESAITVDATTTIKAIAVLDGYANSEIASATYLFPKTVTFNAGSYGTCTTTSLTESGTPGVTLPYATANDGYQFLGWSSTEGATAIDEGLKYGATYYPSANTTLYAVYKKITITGEGTYLKGSTITLSTDVVAASKGGSMKYRWNTCKADGSSVTAIPNATSTSYSLPTDRTGKAGTYYYILTCTETASGNSLVSHSDVITVKVEGAPTFSPAGGAYSVAQEVAISTETEGTTIYYTTDGTAPTTSSTAYSDKVSVPYGTTMTIKAIAVKDDVTSDIASATYTFDPVITTKEGSYNIGLTALDVSTLFDSPSTGAMTYSVEAGNECGAIISGSSLSATAAGTVTVTATQAAVDGSYNAGTATTTVTVVDLGTIKETNGSTTVWYFTRTTDAQASSMADPMMGTWVKNGDYWGNPVTTEAAYWSPSWCEGIQLGLNQAASSSDKSQIHYVSGNQSYYNMYGGAASMKVTIPAEANTLIVTASDEILSNNTGVTFTAATTDGVTTYTTGAAPGDVIEIHRKNSSNIQIKYVRTTFTARTVTFDGNGHGTPFTTSLTEDDVPGVKLPTVTVSDGYQFMGWATTSDATSADAGKKNATYYPTSDCTLYAYYKVLDPATITVTDAESRMSGNVSPSTKVRQ